MDAGADLLNSVPCITADAAVSIGRLHNFVVSANRTFVRLRMSFPWPAIV